MSAAYTVYMVQGIGRRGSQQDLCGVFPADAAGRETERLFLAVSDGMGGAAHGERAAQTVVEAAIRGYEGLHDRTVTGEMLRELLKEINAAVCQAVGDAGGGATALLVALDEDGVQWASAGDTRLYLYRDGVLGQWNEDHNRGALLDSEVRAGERSAGQAARDAKRHALYSYLGGKKIERICFSGAAFALRPGDRLLLATDGVTQALADEKLRRLLSAPPARAADRIRRQIERKRLSDQDNYLAVLVDRSR